MKNKSSKRTRAYFRHHRKRMIQRKGKIAQQLGWHAKFAGNLAKGKIHCSCSYCRKKTREMGLPKSDLVRLDRMGEFYDLEE